MLHDRKREGSEDLFQGTQMMQGMDRRQVGLQRTIGVEESGMVQMVLRMRGKSVSHAGYASGVRGGLIGRRSEGCPSPAREEGVQDSLV